MEKRKSIFGIKSKLISAIAMLLIASVMVASTSYAWFVLSTAPEVSGIDTSIGANGALEIWLNDGGAINSGNIVRLGADYGLNQVILLPSALAATDGLLAPGYLLVPKYNADGQHDGSMGSATAGTFVEDGFFANGLTGVRGVGTAAGMTPREAAYRNAKYAADTNAKLAARTAANSLNTYGGYLGNIIITNVANDYPDDVAAYTKGQGWALNMTVADLKKAVGYIEDAYEQMIIAIAASGMVPSTTEGDLVYQDISSRFADGSLTLAQIAASGSVSVGSQSIPVSGTLLNAIKALGDTSTAVEAAAAACAAANLPTEEPTGTYVLTGIDGAPLVDAEGKEVTAFEADRKVYTWEQLKGIVEELIVMSGVKLNGDSVTGGLDFQALANSVMNNGVNITLESGAGVYSDIADHCGDYSANVTMTNIQADSFSFASMTANMATKSTLEPKYLAGALAQVDRAGAPEGAGEGELPMTSFYGFILDLGFRTNAQSSNLLLQTEAVDRIYKDNEAGAETQGAGSYMTYAAVTNELTNDQVKGLMDCIRIVFFDTADNEVIGEARLDTANATISNDGVTAKMYMYKDGVLQNGGKDDTNNDASIIGLTKNAQTHVSVLVYLDGAELENKDVAATATQSVTGKMNIQFASDADLKPMVYGDLYTPAENN